MKRRHFLGLAVGFTASGCLPVIPKRPNPTREHAVGWIAYRDGGYELTLPRAEFGQNIATALKQIACDELGIEWNDLTVRPHATDGIAPVRATVGSESVKDYAGPLTQACAMLRQAQAGAASPRLRPSGGQKRHVGRPMPIEGIEAIVTGAPLYAADVRLAGQVHGRVLRAPTSPELPSQPRRWNAAAAKTVPGSAGRSPLSKSQTL